MNNYYSGQMSILLEKLIESNQMRKTSIITDNEVEFLINHLPEYFSGDNAELDKDIIFLKGIDNSLNTINIGLVKLYRSNSIEHFYEADEDHLKTIKKDEKLKFALMIGIDRKNNFIIKEVDEDIKHLILDYSLL